MTATAVGDSLSLTPTGATPASFSTEGLAPGDAIEAWRARFGALNEIIPADDGPLRARVSFWRAGRIVFSCNRSSAVRLVRPAARARRDGLDHWVLRVSRHGVARSRSGDRAYVSRPGELVLERLSDGYEDDWGADAWIAAIIPRGVAPGLDEALSGLPRGPLRGRRAALVAEYLLDLDRRLPGLGPDDLAAVSTTTPAMLALLQPRTGADPAHPRLADRLRVETIIRTNLGSARLDGARLAALAGLSRSTLYRLFEDRGGVAAHIREIRLETANAALRDPGRRGETIAAIAARSGFHCQAAFNRTFKRRFGLTPGEARSAAQDMPAGDGSDGRDFLAALLACSTGALPPVAA